MAVAGSDCGKIILLLHVVRELQLLNNNNNNNNDNNNNNNNEKRKKRWWHFLHDGVLALTSKVSSETVQSPFLIGGVFLFRSSATFPLCYGIQTTTTMLSNYSIVNQIYTKMAVTLQLLCITLVTPMRFQHTPYALCWKQCWVIRA